MPKPDHEIIRDVLTQVLPREEAAVLRPRPGCMRVAEETLRTAAGAFKVFKDFHGPGWLQEANTRPILHGDECELQVQLERLEAAAGAKPWPVAGERVSNDGTESLHLRRTAKGWVITWLTDNKEGAGVVLTQRLLSVDLKYYLAYYVAQTPQRVGGHEELRPTASRFAGFVQTPQPVQPVNTA